MLVHLTLSDLQTENRRISMAKTLSVYLIKIFLLKDSFFREGREGE